MNTPQDIEAWIAERKKRFPTANRVADKKAKLEEAIARGQLPFNENPRFPKRPRFEEPRRDPIRGPGGGRHRKVKRGPPGGRDGVVNSKPPAVPCQNTPDPSSLRSSSPAKPPAFALPEDYDSSDSDGAPPEALTTKTTEDTVPKPSLLPETSKDPGSTQTKPSANEKPVGSRRPITRHPRGPPPIPFVQNSSLLRNVRFSVRKIGVDCDLISRGASCYCLR